MAEFIVRKTCKELSVDPLRVVYVSDQPDGA